MSPDPERHLQSIIDKFVNEGKFTAQELELNKELAAKFVQFRQDPVRFLPKIFTGNWAHPERHPAEGNIRLLRVLRGNDGVVRAIGRQPGGIFAYPWL